MMRNLGGAIGIAALQTFLTKREQFHSNILTSSVSMFAEATRERLDHLTAYFLSHGIADLATAQHKAIVAVALRVRQQANIMAFSDTFYMLGIALVVALAATLLLKKPGHIEAGGAH
jgi:DHA2 family multidrug resistance protein